ncbi:MULTISPECIES: gephyrin-like molybdotransferase Glp [Halomonas]|uniref:molybdopterin molybdotransferase MoeA n=1 Tax=Halomonas TaxID=2745 RepID=UPI001CD336DA|nr:MULTISPECIES: gephyrin-like molybdotransferase Glp [Halomonas]MCA0917666.1 molybdopterin molybdenumtransferase MoeA [Halomonas denitrificans]
MMSSLSCFDLGEHMLSVDEARQALLTLVDGQLATESVALAQAHGRVLAKPVTAPFNVPGHTNSAMDGIALSWPEEGVAGSLRRVGSALAGRPFAGRVGSGECVSITTGAPLPAGTDTVIMVEQLQQHGDVVDILQADRVKRGQNVRQAGEDLRRGEVALESGRRLEAAALGLLASLGCASVEVRRLPRVAVFSTGDEVTAPGQPRADAAIYDANRFTLMGMLQEHGADVLDLGIVPDDPQALEGALAQAAQLADLVVSSGGVSVGQADHTRAALERLGRLTLWRIAMRPGRPMACGVMGDGATPFLGLPGNPVACMVTCLVFVIPLVRKLQGRELRSPAWQAVADSDFRSREGRTDYSRGVLKRSDDGTLRVVNTGSQGSGILSSMVAAECLVEIPADKAAVAINDMVTVFPLFRFP